MCKNECKYKIKNEILKEGRLYDGCIKSRKNLTDDICDYDSSFCKEVKSK